MLNRLRPVASAAAALLLAVTIARADTPCSAFNDSIEGWTVETRSSPGSGLNLNSTFTPDYVSSGGHPGAYLSEVDPNGSWSFFRAPDAWMGDLSAYNGGTLRYSTRTNADSFPDGRLVVIFDTAGNAISYDAGIPPLDTWTRRVVPLTPGGWFLGTTARGTPATAANILGILSDADALLIGLEFGSGTAEERVDLDSVSIRPDGFNCSTDLNEDCTTDLADLLQLLSAFGIDSDGDVTGDNVTT